MWLCVFWCELRVGISSHQWECTAVARLGCGFPTGKVLAAVAEYHTGVCHSTDFCGGNKLLPWFWWSMEVNGVIHSLACRNFTYFCLSAPAKIGRGCWGSRLQGAGSCQHGRLGHAGESALVVATVDHKSMRPDHEPLKQQYFFLK